MIDLKLFIRSLWRNKLYSGITVTGFSIALTFVILLGVYIRQELSVDSFHLKKDRIFRLISEKGSIASPVLGERLVRDNPEIESYTRLYEEEGFVTAPDGQKVTIRFLLADPAFFRMFSFPLSEGQAGEVLQTGREIVLSRSFAQKLFGDRDPFGQVVRYQGELPWTVAGVMEDFPENTHFNRCDAVVAFSALADIWGDKTMMSRDGNASFGLYLEAKEGTNLEAKSAEILQQFKKDYWAYDEKASYHREEVRLEPLAEVYFGGWTEEAGIHGNSKLFVSVLSLITLIILMLALINYTNLSIARTSFRAKEAGVRKVLGSSKGRLFRQFITESVLLCILSLGIAFILAILALPLFNGLLRTHVEIRDALTPATFFCAWGGIIVLGVFAGAVPARILTGFPTVEVMKGGLRRRSKGRYGKMLICVQYTVAVLLMICTAVLWKQTDYMRSASLGYEKENVIWLQGMIKASQKNGLREELKRIPGVEEVSYTEGSPLDAGYSTTYMREGKEMDVRAMNVDSAFFRVLKLNVQSTGTAVSSEAVWLNETAVREFGLPALPRSIRLFQQEVPVAGVVKDFHLRKLSERIEPLIIRPFKEGYEPREILIRVGGVQAGQTYRHIRETYARFVDAVPFASGFMDQTIAGWYDQQERTARLIGYFSVLAVVLSMMGILAMATYFIRQRVKEIGIRRVNGASVKEILEMLMGNFMKWIVLALGIGSPAAYYIMHSWLSGFAYRTAFSWWIFAGAGGLTLLLAALMICGQSWKAAGENPVNTLKNE